MQNADLFEERIKETLSATAEQIAASDLLKQNIFNQIINQKIMEVPFMKKVFTIKRAATLAAIICCLLTVTVLASGLIKGYISVSSSTPTYTTLPTEKELSKDLGCVPKTIEAFSNGFTFKNATIGSTSVVDDNGETLSQYNEMSYTYASADGQQISLTVNKFDDASENSNGIVTTYNGIDLTYSEEVMKFVPEDYELTDTDKADEKSGAVTFSYGSDEVKTCYYKFLNWTDNGIDYLILCHDISLTQSDLVDMAIEVINQ